MRLFALTLLAACLLALGLGATAASASIPPGNSPTRNCAEAFDYGYNALNPPVWGEVQWDCNIHHYQIRPYIKYCQGSTCGTKTGGWVTSGVISRATSPSPTALLKDAWAEYRVAQGQQVYCWRFYPPPNINWFRCRESRP